MKNQNREVLPEFRPFMKGLEGGGSLKWWGALACLCLAAIILKASTVSAPVEARTSERADARGSVNRRSVVMSQSQEIRSLASKLAFERQKSLMLEENVQALEARFNAVAEIAQTLMQESDQVLAAPLSDALLPDVPMPVEALFVRPQSSAGKERSQ